MLQPPPGSPLPATLFPYSPRFRSGVGHVLAWARRAGDRLADGTGPLGGGPRPTITHGGHDQPAGEQGDEHDPGPAGAAEVLHDDAGSSSSPRWLPPTSGRCTWASRSSRPSAVTPPSILTSTVPSGATRYDSGTPVTPYSSDVRSPGSMTTGQSPPCSAKNSRT